MRHAAMIHYRAVRVSWYHGAMPNITYEDGPAHITPAAFHAYLATRRGLAPEDLHVAPLVVGTFQRRIWQRLCDRTDAAPDPTAPYGWDVDAMARGSVGGRDVSVVRLPIGAPAAVTWMEEFIVAGARRFIFAGTAGSLQPSLPIGSLALATSAVREEGTSYHYLPADIVPHAAPSLVTSLRAAGEARGRELTAGAVWSTDAVYRETSAKVARYAAQGVLGVEMEVAALFAVAMTRQVEAALIVVMSDELFHPWTPGFHHDALLAGMREAAEIALDAAMRNGVVDDRPPTAP